MPAIAPRCRLRRRLRLHGQWHVVHEGGQQFTRRGQRQPGGRARPAVVARPSRSRPRSTLDGHAVARPRTCPIAKRPRSHRSRAAAFFLRALPCEHGAWRTHLIVWREPRHAEGGRRPQLPGAAQRRALFARCAITANSASPGTSDRRPACTCLPPFACIASNRTTNTPTGSSARAPAVTVCEREAL